MAQAMEATVQETSEELVSIFDSSTCVRKGLCPVTQIRNKGAPLESHSLYFEQHGTGPEKVVFIMGMNSSSFSWEMQVQHFGRLPEYSVLVFDNRGVGYSGVPRGPYTTSGMAEDALTLLEFIGWTEKRDLHVVALSLGGMIAQELAARIPERTISLTLGVTTAGGRPWTNFPPWKGVFSLTRLMTTKDAAVKVPIILEMVFPAAWLDQKADGDPSGRTNREVQAQAYHKRIEITRPQTLAGSVSQMSAALTHRVTPERLRKISASIPKVLIVTGDKDNLVDPRNSLYLKEHMPEAEFVEWEESGHAIHIQRNHQFNALLEGIFKEGRARVTQEAATS